MDCFEWQQDELGLRHINSAPEQERDKTGPDEELLVKLSTPRDYRLE